MGLKNYLLIFAVTVWFGGVSAHQVLVWRSLEELLAGGWYQTQSGVSFSKPSNLFKNLAPLDAGMSGNSVWTGKKYGNYFNYKIHISRDKFCGATEVNVTVRYYYNATIDPVARNGIRILPCLIPSDRYLDGDPAEPVEWHEGGCQVDLQSSFSVGLGVFSWGVFVVILDEIRISHNGICGTTTESSTSTENPDSCNESCEYRAIDCFSYYSCVNFTRKEYFSCDVEDGLAFNPKLGLCDRKESVEGCYLPEDCGCEYRPYEGNCSLFYFCPDKCHEELCEVRSCPEGLFWSVEEKPDGGIMQQCRIPDRANCFNDLLK